jgi:uncharacterized protein (DUF58 family)
VRQAAPSRLIDPRTLAALRDLELAARAVVDGLMFGAHPSRLPGPGLEFSQYRGYQPGDDLRRVDWRLFARADRYWVREADTATSVTVHLAVDTSASMAQAEQGVSKLDYARLLAAALALLALRQGDAVGLYGLNDVATRILAPQRGQRHLHRVLSVLESLAPAGVWPGWPRLETLFTAGGRRGLIVLITDLCEREEEIRAVAAKLAALRHDVTVLHVVARGDVTFDYHGPVAFEELETGRRIEVDADAARAGYLERLARDTADLRGTLAEARADYARLPLDEPLDRALRHYLSRRARRAAA